MKRALLLLFLGCAHEPPPPPPAPLAEKLDLPGIENAYRVSPNLYSGGTPETPEAFAALKALGVKTLISVDGATPDVAAARAAGLNYIHIPVAYDGLTTPQAYAIAKAVQTQPGPVFLHCHHGKHRGPAALAAARLCLEPDYTPGQATAWLQQAGTDPKYTGLMKLPTSLPRPTSEQLDAVPAKFESARKVDDLTHAMVNVDTHWDALKAAKVKDWLGAETYATLLAEDYREARRTLKGAARGEAFRRLLRDAETAANEIATSVKAQKFDSAATAFSHSHTLCGQCHAQYRDGPP